MMARRSCEVSAALLICPSWAREREGAYPCRVEEYHRRRWKPLKNPEEFVRSEVTEWA